MAAARDALLASVEAAVEGAVALASRDDLPSVLQSLSSRELSRLWAALSLHVSAAVRDAAPVLSPEAAATHADDEAVQLSLRSLHAASVIARACAPLEAPAALVDVAVQLHDLIFDISDPRASWVQAAIVDMCEAFWLAEAAARDALVPQMITYLVVRALHEAASAADVKRLYACRGALKALDYADEYTAPLKKLLLHCAIKPQVLRSAEGRKLLVFLFGLHPPFILELHRAIKAQLAVCRKSLRLLYGEVYFRAWRMASGPYVVKMEESVLQDLMFHAVHASSTSMATALMQVLAYTHEQKRQRGVDEMLLRLYEPILWRSLNVANPHVRRNAAAILIEAFPLQDPNKPNVELDQLMQLQFDALQALLKDDVIAVRVVAVQGVCRVLALFWELIPTPTARLLLSLLVKELAHDASANSVRVAVFQGLRFLLANGSSAAIAVLLKGTWSSLAPLINDGSERVRCAMLDFLIEATKSRALHWQFLVKPEMLLPRLAVERPALQLRLTRLLLPLYVPQGRTAAQQLGRLLSLIHEWPQARRESPSPLPLPSPSPLPSTSPSLPPPLCRHIRRLSDLLPPPPPQAACLLLKHAPSFSSAATLAKLLSHLLGATLSSASAAEISAAKSVAALPPRHDPLACAQLTALVDAIASLFDAVGPALSAKEHASARAAMVDDFNAAAMARLEAAAHASAAAQRALMAIAAWLPAESLPGLAKDCLSELAKLPPDASTAQLSPLLQ
ncbi:hypothetical protein AB1Y20_018491 [Prymnesium parvum]|uniref:Condensin complex subunit 1 n=1 Tax=Prymnesium parvum TaxID=97485 RepID=A0AB34JSH5_PRYPA